MAEVELTEAQKNAAIEAVKSMTTNPPSELTPPVPQRVMDGRGVDGFYNSDEAAKKTAEAYKRDVERYRAEHVHDGSELKSPGTGGAKPVPAKTQTPPH